MSVNFETHFQKLISNGTHPGINFSYISGSNLSMKSLGERRWGTGELLTAESIFEIGSLTKLFVGLLYSELFLNKTLASNTRIEELMTFLKGTRAGSIELRELLTHTSGLLRLPVDLKHKNVFDPYANFSIEMFNKELITSNCESRGQYCYSNFGYAVLGNILERVLGKPLENCLHDHIFSQLNMNDTFLATNDLRMTRMSDGHRKNFDIQKPWEMGTFQGAGAIKSTIKDMTKFSSFCLNYREYKLSKAFELSTRRHIDFQEMSLGYGWHVSPNGNLNHDGGTYGFRSSIIVSLHQVKALVVLANSCNEIGELHI